MSVEFLFSFTSSYLTECPVISTIVLLFVVLVVSYYATIPKNLPPGPCGIPWIGSPHLLSDDVHHDFNNLAKKYGDIYTLMMGKRPLIVLNSNRLIRQALVKRGEEFSSRPAMYDFNYMELYDELFNIGFSQKWKERKVAMVRILHAAGFGSNKMDAFLTHLDTMHQHLETETPISTREPIQKVLAMTLADIVYSGGYGYNDPELKTLITLSNEWMAVAAREGMALGYLTDNIPSWITKRALPAMMNESLTTNRTFQKFLIKKIHEHRAVLDKDNPRDVIDGYLAERGDDPELTDIAFSSTILMLFPDGVDSTCCLLQFNLFYLAYYPQWQRKVQDQIDEVCGDNRPMLTDRDKLSLVEATIYEVGRISSVICLTIAHCPIKDTTFEGYNIPLDSYILGNIWAAHMDEEIFPQGELFAPETLINDKGKFIRNNKIMMFSAGHRMCIGSQMVKNMAFLYLSNTLQRYNVSFPEGEPLPPFGSKGGLIREPLPHKICFTPRKPASRR